MRTTSRSAVQSTIHVGRYRKTRRRESAEAYSHRFRPLRGRRTLAQTRPELRLVFVLPPTILVANGPHGFNTNVIAYRVVEIVGWGVEHCCLLARDFLRKVLGQHMPFRMAAVVWSDQPRHFVELDIACADGEADIRRAPALHIVRKLTC